jgi:hypothetical protein
VKQKHSAMHALATKGALKAQLTEHKEAQKGDTKKEKKTKAPDWLMALGDQSRV